MAWRREGVPLRRFQTLSARELLKRGDRLIARIADHDVGDDVRVIDNLRSHHLLLTSADPRASAPRAAAWSPSFRARRLQISVHIAFPWDGVFVGTHSTLDRAGALHIPNLDGLRNLDGLPATRNPR